MAERVDGQLILTHHESDLVRQWFDCVEDMNPDYLKNEDYKLAQQVYDYLSLRQPARMMAGYRRTLVFEQAQSDASKAEDTGRGGIKLRMRNRNCPECGCDTQFGVHGLICPHRRST